MYSQQRRVVTATGRLLSSREQQQEEGARKGRPVVVVWQRCFWLSAVVLTLWCTNPANNNNNEPNTILSSLLSSFPLSSSFSSSSYSSKRSTSSSVLERLSVTNYGLFAVRERRNHLEFWALLREPLVTCSFLNTYNDSNGNESYLEQGFALRRGIFCESLRDLLCQRTSKTAALFGQTQAQAQGNGSSNKSGKTGSALSGTNGLSIHRAILGRSNGSSYDQSFTAYRLLILLLLFAGALTICLQDAEALYYYYCYARSDKSLTILQRLHDAVWSLVLPDARDVLGFLFWNLFDAAVFVFPALQRMDQLVALQSTKSWFRLVDQDYNYTIGGGRGAARYSGWIDAILINYVFSLVIFFFLPIIIITFRSWLLDTQWHGRSFTSSTSVNTSSISNGHSSSNGRRMSRGGGGSERTISQHQQQPKQQHHSPVAPILGFELVTAVSMGFLKGSRHTKIELLFTKGYSVNLVSMAWIRVLSVMTSRAVLSPLFSDTPSSTQSSQSVQTQSQSQQSWSSAIIEVLLHMLHVFVTWAAGFAAGSVLGNYVYDNQVLQTWTRDIWRETVNVFNALLD